MNAKAVEQQLWLLSCYYYYIIITIIILLLLLHIIIIAVCYYSQSLHIITITHAITFITL
jgi:hypothetical protein